MSKTNKVITLIIIVMVIQCVNINTSALQYKNKLISREITHKVEKSLMVQSHKRQNDSLRQRLDNLIQWKLRRRLHNVVSRIYKKSQKLRKRKHAVESDVKSNILDSVQNVSRLSSPQPTNSTLLLIAIFKERWPVNLWRQNGLFTDDYLLLINVHWLRFSPPDPTVQYALGTLYIALMMVGCSGNALVLLLYCRCRTLRTPGNILVANLALSDFLMLAKTPVFVFNSFHLGPALGKTGCVIYGFIGGLTGTTSIATLSAIALDRYWAVVRPLESLRALTAIRARLLAIATWLYATLFSMIPAVDCGYGRYVPEGYLTSCSFDYLTDETRPRYFIFVFFCAAWLAPLCTITFCYINIFRVVAFNRNVVAKNQEHRLSSRHVKEQAKRNAEIKLAFLVIALIALFFISWTPYAVVALLGIFGRKDLITPITSMIPALFCKTAACINPFMYIISHPKFRKEFKKLFYRDKSKHMSGTIKTGISETIKHRASKDLSDTEVEIVEMKDIPYENDNNRGKLRTVSSKVSERECFRRSASVKSLEDSVVSPPSWYAKPRFSKKKSFHRHTITSVKPVTNTIFK